jgi:CrcB protein
VACRAANVQWHNQTQWISASAKEGKAIVTNILVIALGGGMGAALRVGMVALVQALAGATLFPLGILVVNVTGCLAIGAITQYAELTGVLSPELRAFLVAGVLGGYTTYSSFANDTVNLAATGNSWLGFANVALSVVVGLAAVWLGRAVVTMVVG